MRCNLRVHSSSHMNCYYHDYSKLYYISAQDYYDVQLSNCRVCILQSLGISHKYTELDPGRWIRVKQREGIIEFIFSPCSLRNYSKLSSISLAPGVWCPTVTHATSFNKIITGTCSSLIPIYASPVNEAIFCQ